MFKSSTVSYIYIIYVQTFNKSAPRVQAAKCCDGFKIISQFEYSTSYPLNLLLYLQKRSINLYHFIFIILHMIPQSKHIQITSCLLQISCALSDNSNSKSPSYGKYNIHRFQPWYTRLKFHCNIFFTLFCETVE